MLQAKNEWLREKDSKKTARITEAPELLQHSSSEIDGAEWTLGFLLKEVENEKPGALARLSWPAQGLIWCWTAVAPGTL